MNVVPNQKIEKRQRREFGRSASVEKHGTDILLTKVRELHLKNEKLLIHETQRFSNLLEAQKTIKIQEDRFNEMFRETEILKVKTEKDE